MVYQWICFELLMVPLKLCSLQPGGCLVVQWREKKKSEHYVLTPVGFATFPYTQIPFGNVCIHLLSPAVGLISWGGKKKSLSPTKIGNAIFSKNILLSKTQ